jgi:hypothetical protein
MGAVINDQTPSSIRGAVTIRRNPNVFVALLLFCIVPMVVYLISSTKTTDHPFTVQLFPEENGSRVVYGGRGPGLETIERAVSSLPR